MGNHREPLKSYFPRRFFIILWLYLNFLTCRASIQYTAPVSCDWTPVNNHEVSVKCGIQTIVGSGVLATNFSLIQSEYTTTLVINCDPVFFESTLREASMSHLRNLKSLHISQCKFREIPQNAFKGLSELRNLSISTFNNEWNAFYLELRPGSFWGLPQLETLDLSYNKLRSLPEDLCSLNSLKVLNITHNELKDIITFEELNTTRSSCFEELAELDASFNDIVSIDRTSMEKFRNLRILTLQECHMQVIANSTFVDNRKLQVINLSKNLLRHIPEQLFQTCTDLREIHLQENSITALRNGHFSTLKQLLVLNVSRNAIASEPLGSAAFSMLIRLVILDLSNNNLRYINSSTFQSLSSLQMLFLTQNYIDTIEDNAFSSLRNLHTLDLSYNRLKYIGVYSLNGLYVMIDLFLSYNSIYSIHPDAFKNCSSVRDLALQGNHLSQIPQALASLQFIKTLDLSNNTINSWMNISFHELRQMQRLDLSLNRIGNLSGNSFRHLSALTNLDLSRNSIEFLEHGLFEDAISLVELDLSRNSLADINGLFMNLKTLKFLNISHNKISWFDYTLIPTNLKILDMNTNQVEVLANFYEIESSLQLSYLDASFNKIKVLSDRLIPDHIKYFNVSYNNIEIITSSAFSAKNELHKVDFSNNNLKSLDSNTFRIFSQYDEKLPTCEFFISGNPYFCDCSMDWLQNMGEHAESGVHIADRNEVICDVTFTRYYAQVQLSAANKSSFLCQYNNHCFALCHCCDFDACDCEMMCPDGCVCYRDHAWEINIVDCSSRGFLSMPSVIPMDVTDLYLDGNNIFQLTSHTFIGRKNMRSAFLNNSNIYTIHNRTFNGLLSLQILHLENNKLSLLHGYEFDTLVHLKELYLSNNRIEHILNTTFQNLKSLEILHLDYNSIVEFQVWNLGLNTHLVNVQLGNNPWTCKCKYLKVYHTWLQTVSSVVNDIESIQCRQNQTSRSYVLEFDIAICSNQSSITTYLQSVLYGDYIYVIIAVTIVLIVVIIFIVLGCVYHKKLKVWCHNKYGQRFVKRPRYSPEPEKLYDAFISFCKKDVTFVSQSLIPEMECGDPKYRVCLRHRDIPIASYVDEAVTEAIESSHRTIIVISEQYLKSEWCRFELKTAYRETQCNHKHKLIAIIKENSVLKLIDPDTKLCIGNACIVRWKDKRFWEKLKCKMPDVSVQFV